MVLWILLVFWKSKSKTNCRLGEMSLGWVKLKIFFIDLQKCQEGLVKLVMISYRLGEKFGGLGETSYDQL